MPKTAKQIQTVPHARACSPAWRSIYEVIKRSNNSLYACDSSMNAKHQRQLEAAKTFKSKKRALLVFLQNCQILGWISAICSDDPQYPSSFCGWISFQVAKEFSQKFQDYLNDIFQKVSATETWSNIPRRYKSMLAAFRDDLRLSPRDWMAGLSGDESFQYKVSISCMDSQLACSDESE